jgi:hypothetical protein
LSVQYFAEDAYALIVSSIRGIISEFVLSFISLSPRNILAQFSIQI